MKYSESEILAVIDREEGQSYVPHSGKLKAERDEALDYYLGEPYGNEVQDRSQVVTREVLETVEWVLPSLLKVFFAGDEVCRFEPRGPEDVEAADQETEYINFIVQQKNPGFNIFYTWFKDALLSKTGYVGCEWEVKEDLEDERYEGLTEDELAFLLGDREVEILEQLVMPDLYGNPLYTVKLRQTVSKKQVRIFNAPPEEMLVSTRNRAVSLKNSPFVEHRCYKSISDLRDAGHDVDLSKMASSEMIDDFERDIYDEAGYWQDSETEEAMRPVLVRNCYVRLDDDGDGIAELMHILIAGTQVLVREPVDFIPFVAICPVPMPHRHIGLSYADLAMPSQLHKSTILRQIMDNMYHSNNVRMAFDPSRVNLDDVLVSRPGGVIRTKGDPAGAIQPIVSPAMYSQAFSMLEYLDTTRENSTGVTKYNQGLDANSLNKTATGINAIMGASQQRLELVTRLFAEEVKELFLMVHALTAKYSDNAEQIKLRNKFVSIDPRGWKKRTDLSISVGLGTGNKQEMLQHLMMILQAQEKAAQVGLATPKNVYNALAKLTQNAGFKDVESYWTDPESEGFKSPNQIPQQVQEMIQKGQAELQRLAQENQKLQATLQARDADTSVKMYEVDKRSDTEIQKVMMQNESKEALARFNAIAKAIMESQNEMAGKMQEMEQSEPDFTPILEIVASLQDQITNMQPIGIRQVRDESGKLIGGVRIMPDGSEQEISIQ